MKLPRDKTDPAGQPTRDAIILWIGRRVWSVADAFIAGFLMGLLVWFGCRVMGQPINVADMMATGAYLGASGIRAFDGIYR